MELIERESQNRTKLLSVSLRASRLILTNFKNLQLTTGYLYGLTLGILDNDMLVKLINLLLYGL